MKIINRLFFLLLGLSLTFMACESDLIQEEHNAKKINSFASILDMTPVMNVVDGIPYYESTTAFVDTHIELEELNDAYFSNIDDEYPNLNEDEIESLFESGKLNDYAVYNKFKSGAIKTTLLDVEENILSDWMAQPNVDFDTYPSDQLTEGMDNTMKSMVNHKGLVNIGGEIINLKEINTSTDNKSGWCVPSGSRFNVFFSSDRKYAIVVSGGLGSATGIFGFSYISGGIVSFKKNNNGNYTRYRTSISIQSACTVRKSPLNDCDIIGGINTGVKTKSNRKNTSVTKWGGVQGWYKRTVNAGAQGAAAGSSSKVSKSTVAY